MSATYGADITDHEHDHPAKFSPVILDRIAELLPAHTLADDIGRPGKPLRVLDPFAGVGRIHLLRDLYNLPVNTTGIELEPEFASGHPRTIVGDSRDVGALEVGEVDAIVTSPCLEESQRILTDDLRWRPVGDVDVGDKVLAFDEGAPIGSNGNGNRRKWQRAEIIRAVPRSVECMRVILANGDEVITTPEHPWLAQRYSYQPAPRWVRTSDLAGQWVHRHLTPWAERRNYDAGWLAGMFDGEGSLSLGGHGAPKLTLCQTLGPVLDRAHNLMAEFGYNPNLIERKGVPEHRQRIANLYVTGGFPGILQALGELRPTRLLAKWEDLDITTRTVQPERIEVLGVEPAGRRDIMEIETTAGTYFGEGYMHHNCYGNRMADSFVAKDASRRHTYHHNLGRKPSTGSAAVMRWGPQYRRLHLDVYRSCADALTRPGLVVLNVSNHLELIRKGGPRVEWPVVEWHLKAWLHLGGLLRRVEPIATPRQGHGANGDVRVDAEFILVFVLPANPAPER